MNINIKREKVCGKYDVRGTTNRKASCYYGGRLLDMGLIPKTAVEVRKVAPMGDPIEIRIRGYELTIRREDAAKIEVKPEEEK